MAETHIAHALGSLPPIFSKDYWRAGGGFLTVQAADFFLTTTFSPTDVTLFHWPILCPTERVPIPSPHKESLAQGYWASHVLTKSWGNRGGIYNMAW